MEALIEANKKEEESEVVDLDKFDNSLKSTGNYNQFPNLPLFFSNASFT